MQCNKTYKKKFAEDLSKRFGNRYQFYDGEFNKFSIILWRGVYSYEYMDCWKSLDEMSLLSKKEFYSNLAMDSTKGDDEKHPKRVWEDSE